MERNNSLCRDGSLQPPGPSLLDLPNELLFNIAESLVDCAQTELFDDHLARFIQPSPKVVNPSSSKLLSLSLSCRRMLEPFKSALYRHIVVDSQCDESLLTAAEISSSFKDNLKRYTKTICIRSGLADPRWINLIHSCPLLVQVDVSFLTPRAMKSFERWKHLRLDFAGTLRSLNRLERLDVCCLVDFPAAEILELVNRGSLRHLALADISISRASWNTVTFPLAPSHRIRYLTLEFARLQDPLKFFSSWVKGANKASLSLHIRETTIYEDDDCFQKVIQILGPYLFHLSLQPRITLPYNEMGSEFDNLGSLVNLKSLTVLEGHEPSLDQLNLLPKSIRRLSFSQIGYMLNITGILPQIFATLERWLTDSFFHVRKPGIGQVGPENDDRPKFNLRYIDVDFYKRLCYQQGEEGGLKEELEAAAGCDSICRDKGIETLPISFERDMRSRFAHILEGLG